MLVALDGAKALRKAVRDVLGADTPVQRCIRHKQRNVEAHLPERERPWVRARLARGARPPARDEPPWCGGVAGPLKGVFASTNPVESMIEIVRATQRNVKRWRSGEMALRWTVAGMLEAERPVSPRRRLPRAAQAARRDRARGRAGEEAPMIEAA